MVCTHVTAGAGYEHWRGRRRFAISACVELERFDLSLPNRRATANAVVSDAARAMREAGLGLKAATITPESANDVGSPNRILREEVDGKVIVRTGRRLPGAAPPVRTTGPVTPL